MSTTQYQNYNDLFSLLCETQSHSLNQYSMIRKYFVSVSSDVDELIGAIQKFQNEVAQKPDKRAKASYQTEIGKVFPALASTRLMQEEAFSTICACIKNDIITKIDKDCHEYQAKFNELLARYTQNISSLNDRTKKYESLHADYFKAGKAAKDAIAKKTRNANDLKNNFLKSKKAALNGHKELSDFAAELSVRMEALLTEFEDLEHWRSEKIQDVLNVTSDALFKISTSFVEGKSYFFAGMHHAPIEKDGEAFKEDAQLPEASDAFQLVRVNPALSHYLKPEELFPQETANRAPIFRARQDFVGIGAFLKVREGDVVAQLAEDGENIKCKNVNDSVGLIPKNILEKVQ